MVRALEIARAPQKPVVATRLHRRARMTGRAMLVVRAAAASAFVTFELATSACAPCECARVAESAPRATAPSGAAFDDESDAREARVLRDERPLAAYEAAMNQSDVTTRLPRGRRRGASVSLGFIGDDRLGRHGGRGLSHIESFWRPFPSGWTLKLERARR